MIVKINALLLEDDEDDLTLLLMTLKKAGYALNYKNVQTPEEYIEALKSQWDIIISDYSLPKINGMEALNILKNLDIDIPFIIVSGTIGEEIAVSTMRAGANDYIMKNNMHRLIPAIERELKEAEIRRDKKNTELRLVESTKRYKGLFENSSAVMLLFDNETYYIVDANLAAEKFYGYSLEQFRKIKITNLIAVEEKFSNIKMEEFVLGNSIFKHKLASGQIRDVEVYCSPIEIEKKQFTYSIVQDITERINFEQQLVETKNIIHSVYDASPVGIIMVNLAGKILNWNKKVAALTGYSKKEAINNNIIELFGKNDNWLGALKYEIFKSENITEMEDTIKDKFGNIISVELSVNHLEDKIGIVSALLIMISDTTQKIENQKELNKLFFAIEQSSVAIVFTDLKGNIEYANPKLFEITGFTKEELHQKNINIFKSDKTDHEIYNELWMAINRGKEWRGELLNRRKDNSEYWESISIAPVCDLNGAITNFLAIKEDITAKKNAEKDLLFAIQKAEESSKLKSTLLANLSHEFRTPLNGILGFAEIMKNELTEPDQRDMAEFIVSAGQRLLATLTSILDLSELQSESIIVAKDEINITAKSRQIITKYLSLAKEKNLKLSIVSTDNNLVCLLDIRLFEKTLGHLINNAIKFTDKGEVKIIIDSVVEKDGKYALIKIVDTGIGISEENKLVVFEDFRQLSEGLGRKYEGNGLGLPLAKRMTELLNGTICLESKPFEGTTVILKFKSTEKNYKTNITSYNIEAKINETKILEVLLVEDSFLNMEVIKWYLSGICNINYAESGEIAIEMAKQFLYDVVLMDINLGPGINGVETTKTIRKIPGYNSVPVVALTGYVLSGDEQKLKKEGLDYYIAKPFTKEDLTELFEDIRNSS
ncbi:MAG: PAS domain S-box protein [bacterium]